VTAKAVTVLFFTLFSILISVALDLVVYVKIFFQKYTDVFKQIDQPEASVSQIYCSSFNPLNPELNPICCLLALLGAHHFLHVSRI